jgi:hypothetical protein
LKGRKQETKLSEVEARTASPARGVVHETLKPTKLSDAASADTEERREERERKHVLDCFFIWSCHVDCATSPPTNKP